MNSHVRLARLYRAIAWCTARGWTLETVSAATHTAILRGKEPEKIPVILHLVLTVFFCLLWIPFWVGIAIAESRRTPRALILSATDDGRVTFRLIAGGKSQDGELPV